MPDGRKDAERTETIEHKMDIILAAILGIISGGTIALVIKLALFGCAIAGGC
jgi:hypothetical protein